MHGADDIIATLSGRVGDLSKRVALLQAELDGANRRVAVYEENDPSIQEAISAALRAAYQIRERAETTAEQILEQAREERRLLLKEIERLRDERDALQEEIATQRRSSISAVAPRPLSSDSVASELRSVASEALKGLFQELVDDMKTVTRAAAFTTAAPPVAPLRSERAPEPMQHAPERIERAAESMQRAAESMQRVAESMPRAAEPAARVPEPAPRAAEPAARAPEPIAPAPQPVTSAPEPIAAVPEPTRPAATTTEPAVAGAATWRPAVAWTEPPPPPPVVEPPLRYAATVQPEPTPEPAPTYEAMARLKRARMTEEEDLPTPVASEPLAEVSMAGAIEIPFAPAPVAEAEPEAVAEAMAEVVAEAEPEAVAEAMAELVAEAEAEPEAVAEAMAELVAEAMAEPVAESEPEPVAEAMPEPVAESGLRRRLAAVEAEKWVGIAPEQATDVAAEPVAEIAAESSAGTREEPRVAAAQPRVEELLVGEASPQPEPERATAARQMPPPLEVLRPRVEVEEIAPARVEPVAATTDILLMLSPIRSFPRLIEIERHIQALPAVRTLYVRDFRGGVATLAVALRSAMAPTDFAVVLAGLGQPRMRLVSGSRNMLELRVEGEASIA